MTKILAILFKNYCNFNQFKVTKDTITIVVHLTDCYIGLWCHSKHVLHYGFSHPEAISSSISHYGGENITIAP